MTVVTDKDREAAQMLANLGPAILRGIYRDDLERAFAAHREDAVRELVEKLGGVLFSLEWAAEQCEAQCLYDDAKAVRAQLASARTALANHKGDE